MPRRRALALGDAFVLAVAIAFLAGLAVADRSQEPLAPAAENDAEFREVFSPVIRKDPYFRRRQRENVEALEEHCRRNGAMCAEARAARKSFEASSGKIISPS